MKYFKCVILFSFYLILIVRQFYDLCFVDTEREFREVENLCRVLQEGVELVFEFQWFDSRVYVFSFMLEVFNFFKIKVICFFWFQGRVWEVGWFRWGFCCVVVFCGLLCFFSGMERGLVGNRFWFEYRLFYCLVKFFLRCQFDSELLMELFVFFLGCLDGGGSSRNQSKG